MFEIFKVTDLNINKYINVSEVRFKFMLVTFNNPGILLIK